METKIQMPSVDDTIINLSYLYVMGAAYMLQVLTESVKTLKLNENFTKEQKRTLRRDGDFTWKAVQYLCKAQDDYKALMRDLDIVESELNKRVKPELYNYGVANMLDLLSADLVYMTLCCENDVNNRKVHNYLQKYSWPDDLRKAYDMLQRRAKGILKQQKDQENQ